MEPLFQDVRYALRVLARAPAFTLIALLTLAIGTGANATVFGFVSALLLRPAPGVEDPRSLVALYTSDFSSGPYGNSSYPDFLSLQAETSAFSMAAAQEDASAVVDAGDVVERVRMSRVTGEYFAVLGVGSSHGRLITAADCGPQAPPVAVLGFRLWERLFERDPAILGRPVKVDGVTYAVIGIAAEAFEGLDLGRAFEIWTPLMPPPASAAERDNRRLAIVARLKPGVGLSEAQTQVSALAARLGEAYPDTNRGTLAAPDAARPMLALRHTRLPPQVRGMVTTIGAILMTAVALVLIIACANIASLLLSRATSRDRELAVRLALGATPGRLVRQMLTESLVLGLGAGALGLLLSLWTADLLPSFFPPDQARMLDTSIDATTIAFVLGMALAGSILFGLAPALQAAAPSAMSALRTGASRVSAGGPRRRLRQLLVTAQIAVSVVLLVAAALLVRSLRNVEYADLGFETRDAVIASVELPTTEFDVPLGLAYYSEVLERVRGLPGVESAAFASTLPLARPARRGFRIEGYVPRPGEGTELSVNVVTNRYFETMGIRLLEGRVFDEPDHARGLQVAIVNDLLAKRYFDGRAVGRLLTDSRGRVLTIVGVVRTGTNLSVQESPVPFVFYPVEQDYVARMTLVARTAMPPLSLMEPIRREMMAVDRTVAVFRTMPLDSHIAEAHAGDRLTTALVTVCGGVALLLAAIGLYGVIAYAVAIRRHEIGVRLALGAQPVHIVRLVAAEGLGIVGVGLVAGAGLALAASRGLESLLFGVSAADPVTYAAVPVFLAIVALLAAWLPARRALRVEPTAVLRQE